jgi:uncharacterized RDD family membrane protein YckC
VTAVTDRVAQFLGGGTGNRRDILTPEGVALPVEIAPIGERLAAFALDLVFWLASSVILFLLLGLLLGSLTKLFTGARDAASALLLGVLLFVGFLVRKFYFIHFELAWRGATPGKRLLGLRVIDRLGGPLLPAAVIARNLTREIEMFLPLGLLLSLRNVPGTAVWEPLSLGAWLLLFAALPCFNRDRMRAGDLIAGTIVVTVPRRALLGDLVDAALRHVFTEKQLRAYGAFVLQILEELLRRPLSRDTERLKREVADKIIRKIAWPSPLPEHEIERFLRDFYTAERAFLEREQLFGKPRVDKHAEEKAGG